MSQYFCLCKMSDEKTFINKKIMPIYDLKKKWPIVVIFTNISIIIICIIFLFILSWMSSPSSIKVPPRKGFIFFPQQDEIRFNPDDPSSYRKYVDSLNSTILPYENTKIEGNMIDCSKREPREGEVCFITDTWLNNCRKQSLWGYKDASPCVILSYRDDQDFDFIPYGKNDKLPENMPNDLKIKIRESTQEAIWVSCNDADLYNPYPGFLLKFFKMRQDVRNYLSPLVGVEFDMSDRSELDVMCRLWSKTASGLPFAEVSFKIVKNVG